MGNYKLSSAAEFDLKRIWFRGLDSIYYRIQGNNIEIMRVLGRQNVQLNLSEALK